MKKQPLPPNWRYQHLRELISRFDAGVSVNGGDRCATGDEYGVLKISAVTDGRFCPDENKVIEGFELARASLNPKADRVILSRANTPDLVGASAYVRREHSNLFLPDKLWQLEPRSDHQFSMRWLGFVLASSNYRKKMGKLATGSSQSMKNISQASVMQLEIPVPPHEEQKHIAKLLEAWESAIEKTEQLIFLRKKQKAWFLSRVVAASGTFTKLGNFLQPSSRPVPKPNEPYWALGIRSHGKGTFQRFVENPEGVAMEQLYALDSDDVIVNITFAWEGAIATVKQEDINCLVSHRFPTYRVDRERADPEFVKHVINRKEFFSQLALISPGGAGRNRVLNKKDFLKLTVPMPPLAEQQRLARILSALDDLVANQQLLLGSLASQKRGLMQKLLTGQWRIKPSSSKE